MSGNITGPHTAAATVPAIRARRRPSRSEAIADTTGWPLIEETWSFDGLTSQAALDAETKRASDASAGAKQLFEFDLAITQDVTWWQWELGGMARVVVTDHLYPALPDGSPGLDRSMKIVSLKVQPDSEEGELVTVTTGELTVADQGEDPMAKKLAGKRNRRNEWSYRRRLQRRYALSVPAITFLRSCA